MAFAQHNLRGCCAFLSLISKLWNRPCNAYNRGWQGRLSSLKSVIRSASYRKSKLKALDAGRCIDQQDQIKLVGFAYILRYEHRNNRYHYCIMSLEWQRLYFVMINFVNRFSPLYFSFHDILELLYSDLEYLKKRHIFKRVSLVISMFRNN